MTDDPIPWLSFPEIVINLNLPEYAALRLDGGIKVINDGGVRGLIVYRINASSFHAYERNCSFRPNESGATVDVHTSNLYLTDYSCGSTFSLEEGSPTGGPAWRPLRQYHTVVNSGVVTITDQAIN